MNADDVRARFEVELAKLPTGAQANIRDAMSRGESLSFNMFAAGYRAAVANETLQEKTTAEDEREAFDAWWITTGIVFSSDREIAWNAWSRRAAHADLSGEVRELKLVIEGLSQYSHNAQEVRDLVEAARYAMNNIHMVDGTAMDAVVGPTFTVYGMFLNKLHAALAKFHPTQPAGDSK